LTQILFTPELVDKGPMYVGMGRHTDHLGSPRFASTISQTLYSDNACSPFGQPYASSAAIDNSFTGQNQDTTAGLYDFLRGTRTLRWIARRTAKYQRLVVGSCLSVVSAHVLASRVGCDLEAISA
jgi:hypothetical protein